MGTKRSIIEDRQKWGIPNWHHVEEYPFGISDVQWHWEFLRRRTDYRNDWQQWAPCCGRDYQTDPAFRVMMHGALEKYNLFGLINPALTDPKDLQFGMPSCVVTNIRKDANGEYREFEPGRIYLDGKAHRTAIPEGCCVLVFDLRKDLAPQIKDMTAELYKLAKALEIKKCKQRRRAGESMWRTYLRVLDARAEGAKWKTIWYVISPNHALLATDAAKGAQDWHRKATALSGKFGF